MIIAALEIVFAESARPPATAAAVVVGLVVALLDAREQEHLVVHREAEHDRQHQRRRQRVDVAEVVEADDAVEPALLEDDHQHAVGRADREQVHQRRPSAAGRPSASRSSSTR